MRPFTANASRRVSPGVGGWRVVVCVLLGILAAGSVSAQPGGGAGEDTAAVTRVMGSLKPSYSTNYNVNRLTTDWLQNFDFGANFSLMNFTNKTNFDVHTDDGRDETRRNGRNKLDMRWFMIRNLPITTSFNLERTATARSLEERQIDVVDLNLSTQWIVKALGAKHTLGAGGGLNRRTDVSNTSKANNTSVDGGWTGNGSWRSRWRMNAFTIDGSASLRRISKTSELESLSFQEQGDTLTVQTLPTKNLARAGRVAVSYDPGRWLTTTVDFSGNFGEDEYFLTREAKLEQKENQRRIVNAGVILKPRPGVDFTWNLSTNDNFLSYKESTRLATSGNGFSWDGKLVFKNVLGAVIEGTVRRSNELLERVADPDDGSKDPDTETLNNVFEGKLDKPFGANPRFTFRFNWQARATQLFFSDARDTVDVPNPDALLDRDELRTKLQPTLIYTPGNKWTVTASFIRAVARQIQVNERNANQTKQDEDYTVDISIGYALSPRTSISQIYSIKALYTTFDFRPDQDRLLSTQRIVTSINSQVSQRVNLGMEHRFSLQDSGPFRFEDGVRVFSRSVRRYRQELVVDVRYNLMSWVSLLVNSRFLRTDDLDENTNINRINKNMDLRIGGDLDKALGRGLAFKVAGQYTRSNSQDSFWTIASSLTKDF